MAEPGSNAEFDSILGNEELTAEIINKVKGPEGNLGIKPDDIKPDDIKPDGIKPDEIKPDEIKPDEKKDVLNPETIKAGMLNEMFGDQFQTVEDFKNAKIPERLKELETLREANLDLTTKLGIKPKHSFASDDIAKFNEFSRETKISNFDVFNQLNSSTDIANMDTMDALVLNHIVENPEWANDKPKVRAYFETKYNLDKSKFDPKKVEAEEITQEEADSARHSYDMRMMDASSDAKKAKTSLLSLKEKIKMPEEPEEMPGASKKWTPEIEKTQKESWAKVNEKIGEVFAKLPIPIKDSKEPIVNFVIPEEAQKAIMKDAFDYAVSNQMEVNEANVTSVATFMRSRYINDNLPSIVHTVFERARSMTDEEYLKVYHNPSPSNKDQPDVIGEPLTEEQQRDKAFDMESNR